MIKLTKRIGGGLKELCTAVAIIVLICEEKADDLFNLVGMHHHLEELTERLRGITHNECNFISKLGLKNAFYNIWV